mmetsp:Transcript_11527/g.23393  ORF Transcript_11527/g.23393 Transcript_11527/m.23393 type:complete len:81 (-) Transcript_11527:452-694(-)
MLASTRTLSTTTSQVIPRNGRPPSVPHAMANPGNYSRDGTLSSEMSTGILDEQGPVVQQIGSFATHVTSSKASASVPIPQ